MQVNITDYGNTYFGKVINDANNYKLVITKVRYSTLGGTTPDTFSECTAINPIFSKESSTDGLKLTVTFDNLSNNTQIQVLKDIAVYGYVGEPKSNESGYDKVTGYGENIIAYGYATDEREYITVPKYIETNLVKFVDEIYLSFTNVNNIKVSDDSSYAPSSHVNFNNPHHVNSAQIIAEDECPDDHTGRTNTNVGFSLNPLKTVTGVIRGGTAIKGYLSHLADWADDYNTHKNNKNNPHEIKTSQIPVNTNLNTSSGSSTQTKLSEFISAVVYNIRQFSIHISTKSGNPHDVGISDVKNVDTASRYIKPNVTNDKFSTLKSTSTLADYLQTLLNTVGNILSNHTGAGNHPDATSTDRGYMTTAMVNNLSKLKGFFTNDVLSQANGGTGVDDVKKIIVDFDSSNATGVNITSDSYLSTNFKRIHNALENLKNHIGSNGSSHSTVTSTKNGFMSSDWFKKLSMLKSFFSGWNDNTSTGYLDVTHGGTGHSQFTATAHGSVLVANAGGTSINGETKLPVNLGGTGKDSLTAGEILLGNGTSGISSASKLSISKGGTNETTLAGVKSSFGITALENKFSHHELKKSSLTGSKLRISRNQTNFPVNMIVLFSSTNDNGNLGLYIASIPTSGKPSCYAIKSSDVCTMSIGTDAIAFENKDSKNHGIEVIYLCSNTTSIPVRETITD